MFGSREAVDEYLLLTDLTDRHRELIDANQQDQLPALAEELLAFRPTHASSQRRWDKLCDSLARDLERQSSLQLAGKLYERSTRHPARERRARIHEQQQQLPAAITLCSEIMQQPWCEAELDAARRILPRVKRKLDGSHQ